MTSQALEANVVLTADNSQYQQSMQQSAQATDQLSAKIDSLGHKMSSMTKTAGKLALGFTATDVGLITAATTAYGAFEKQMTSLSVQAAMSNRQLAAQRTTYAGFADDVNHLRSSFASSTSEAAQLVQQVSRVSDNTTSVKTLTDSFTKLGLATGESTSGLANSMTNLARSMGVPQRSLDTYNNQLAVLSNRSNVGAQSIADFANQLAPIGRSVNMSMTDIMGISSAFQKAGQDGYQAANVFAGMMSNIAQASQTGSPDLALYANLVGTTVEQFQRLSGTQQLTSIFDAISQQGPRAISILNQMGYDGVRTVRTIQAVAQQGGVQQEIAAAAGADPNAMGRGAGASMQTMAHQLSEIRSELAQTGEAFGSNFRGPAHVFLSIMGDITHVVKDLMASPLGRIGAIVMTMAGAFAAVVGPIMLASRGLAAFAAANLAVRNSLTYGFREGRAATAMGLPGMLGTRGEQIMRPIDEGGGNFVNRFLYRRGYAGGMGSQFLLPGRAPGEEGPGLISRAFGRGFQATGWLARQGGELTAMQFNAARYNPYSAARGEAQPLDTPTARMRFFNRASLRDYSQFRLPLPPIIQNRLDQAADERAAEATRGVMSDMHIQNQWRAHSAAEAFARAPMGPGGTLYPRMTEVPGLPVTGRISRWAREIVASREAGRLSDEQVAKARSDIYGKTEGAGKGEVFNRERLAGSVETFIRFENATEKSSAALRELSETTKGAGARFRTMISDMAMAGRMVGGEMLGAGAGAGLTAMKGIGKIGSSAFQGLFGGNPWIAGLMLAPLAFEGMSKLHDAMTQNGTFNLTDTSGFGNAYLQRGNVAPPATFNPVHQAADAAQSVGQAQTFTALDQRAAGSTAYKLNTPELKGLTKDQALARMAPYWQMIKNSPGALQALKTDFINQYGFGTAQTMFQQLERGATPDATTTFLNAVQGASTNAFGVPNATEQSKAYSNLGGELQDQASYIASTEGARSAQQFIGGRFEQMLGQTARRVGRGTLGLNANFNTETGSYSDPHRQQRIQYVKSVMKQFFPNINLTDDQAAMFKIPIGGSNQDAARSFVGQMMTGVGGGILTAEQQQNVATSFGLSPGDTGAGSVSDILNRMTTGKGMNLGGPNIDARINRIQGIGDTYRAVPIQNAITSQSGNANYVYRAALGWVQNLQSQGQTLPQINTILGRVQSAAGTDQNQQAMVANLAQGIANQITAQQLPTMSLGGQAQAQMSSFLSTMRIDPGKNKTLQDQQNAAVQAMEQWGEGIRQHFVQLLTQQREFNIQQNRAQADFNTQRDRMEVQFNLQRTRAEHDYHQQQRWALQDFHTQREHAEIQYQTQRERNERSFQLQMRRGRQDFAIQRRRDEADYQHQVLLMTEATAKNAYNIYQRVQVQRTSSADWLLGNAQDQLERLRQQEDSLNQLRNMGLGDQAIQQLGLTDPNNSQQLARFMTDVTENPQLIQSFNQAIQKRLKAAAALTEDKSSSDWQEFVRQHELAIKRAQADFDRNNARARHDFQQQMTYAAHDFKQQMDWQAQQFDLAMQHQNTQFNQSMQRSEHDYNVSISQMETDFNKQMNRAKDDINRQSKTIDGDLMTILKKSTTELSGHAAKQAQTVIDQFDNFKKLVRPKAVGIMSMLADIFGVKYHAPKTGDGGGGGQTANPVSNVHHGGQAINTVGGGAGGRSANTDAQDRAEYGRADSPITNGHVTYGYGERNPRYAKGYHTGEDFAVPVGTPIHAALAGVVSKAGWGGDYGNLVVIDHGGGLQTMYAHESQMRAHVGEHVDEGQVIGYTGATGNVTGPHLHFEVREGGVDVNPDVLGKLVNYAGKQAATTTLDVLKDRYPELERATAAMSGLQVLQPGDISNIINQMATGAATRMSATTGMSIQQALGLDGPAGAASAPANVSGNKALGKKMAAARGWTGNEWDALYQLWMGESGWRTTADNPNSSAYGIPQALPGSKMSSAGADWATNPATQIRWGLNYIKSVYGDPQTAYSKWLSRDPHWYGQGGVFTGPQVIGVGDTGPETVLPLNNKGVNFLASVMERLSVGSAARGMNTSGFSRPMVNQVHNNYAIDRSTTFSGNISVQANNPNELITQLKNRQRTAALTSPRGGVKVA